PVLGPLAAIPPGPMRAGLRPAAAVHKMGKYQGPPPYRPHTARHCAMAMQNQDPVAVRSLYSRLFFRFLDWLQRRIARASLVGDRPIFDPGRFPWIAALEARAPAIRAELLALLQERER